MAKRDKIAILLFAAIIIAHLGYWAFPEPLRPRVFYIGRGIEGMVLFGLLLHLGPRWGALALACICGYFEEWQTAVCRIATFSESAPAGQNSMICVGWLGVRPYQALLAATLAVLALGWVQTWPRR